MVVFGDTRTSLANIKDWKDVVEVPAPSKIGSAGFVAGGKWIMHADPDRKLIVAAIGGKTSKIEIKEDLPFGYTFGDGVNLSPSPSSRIAFGTLHDGRGVIVDPRTNAVQRRLVDPSESDFSWDSMMQMAPAGDRAYSAGSDSKIRVWDVSSGRLIRRLAGHKAEVNSVSPDGTGTRLATGSDDKTAKIWDLKTGKVIRSFLCSGDVVWASISPDGSLLVTRDSNSVKVWKISTGRRLREYPKATVAVWSGSGSELLLGGNDSLALVDVITGVRKVKYTWIGSGPVALSIASDKVLLTVSESGSVRLFDKKNGQELATIQYFQDGSWIANDSTGAYTTSAGAQIPQLTFMDNEGLNVLTSGDPAVKAKYDPQLLERILKR
jgi:WD40 repeat protein